MYIRDATTDAFFDTIEIPDLMAKQCCCRIEDVVAEAKKQITALQEKIDLFLRSASNSDLLSTKRLIITVGVGIERIFLSGDQALHKLNDLDWYLIRKRFPRIDEFQATYNCINQLEYHYNAIQRWIEKTPPLRSLLPLSLMLTLKLNHLAAIFFFTSFDTQKIA